MSLSDANDHELMLSFQQEGDLAAFEELFRRHKDMLLRFLIRLSANHAIAEDVSQQAWLKAIDVARVLVLHDDVSDALEAALEDAQASRPSR